MSGSSPSVVGRRSSVRSYLPLAVVMIASGAASLLLILAPTHPAADVTHYKYWTRLVTFEGLAGAYSGSYPQTAAIYPPVTLYGYRLVGLLYEGLVDPVFNLERALRSQALTALVKLVAVVPHLVAIAVIFRLLIGRYGARVALVAAAAYGLNPAALFDLAYWGQPDSVHALFLVLAVWLLAEDRPVVGWAFAGLAAATKPQAWVLLPFIAYTSLRRFGTVQSVLGMAAAGVVVLVVCLPYVVAGTFGQLLTLPALITETMPVASANAHNLWWLVTGGRPDFVPDAEPLVGGLTYRHVALVLSLMLLAYGLWRTDPHASAHDLLSMAAYLTFGWFLVTTRAHENHAFLVLPLLAMAAPRAGFLAVTFVVVSLTMFLNMVLHDFTLAPIREQLLPGDLSVRVQLLNASVNLLLFALWSAWVWSRSGSILPRWRGVHAHARS